MKIKILVLTFAFIVACSISAVAGCQVDKSTDESFFSFELGEDEQSYVVSAAEGVTMPETVFVPAEHNGLPVTAVKENGFSAKNCYAIKDVVLRTEKTLTLGANAFENLLNLRSVEFKAEEILLKASVFAGCTALTEVEFGEKAVGIQVERYAFNDCSKMTELKFVTVKSDEFVGGTELGEFALYGMKGLEKLTVSNLKTFAPTAITGCNAIAEFDVKGEEYNSAEGDLYKVTSAGTELVRYAPAKAADTFTVNTADLTCIRTGAFENAANLKTVIFGENVAQLTIEDYAFAGSSVETLKGYSAEKITAGKNWLGESKIKTIE